MVDRIGEQWPVSMLRTRWLLVDIAVQQMVRSKGDYLHYMSVLGHSLLLARLYQYMVAHVCRSLCTWTRHWPQIRNSSSLRR